MHLAKCLVKSETGTFYPHSARRTALAVTIFNGKFRIISPECLFMKFGRDKHQQKQQSKSKQQKKKQKFC